MHQDKIDAVLWARNVLEDCVILDTETTGLSDDAQIVQIGIIDQDGAVLLDRLVLPTVVISMGAEKIHGITREKLLEADAGRFIDVYDSIAEVVFERRVLIYNVAYDWPILRRQCESVERPMFEPSSVACAMGWIAQFVGDWNNRHGGYRWQKLLHGDHSAVGDCQAVLRWLREMAEFVLPDDV